MTFQDFRALGGWLMILVFSSGTLSAATNLISGDVTNNTTWSGTNLVQGTITVRSNVVLTIAPGTRLLMNTGATLVVNGQLLANGTTNEQINFTRATTAARWGRIRLVKAQSSLLRNCIIEYSNCAGDHKDYYPKIDCNTNTPPTTRVYHEAIVVLASHLEIDSCIFRNLPDSSASAEGDAIAIVSDDLQNPGAASAHIHHSQFLSIGQGVHTRYSYVLVENCYFTGHHGDNDDVDLYGESTPVPMIRNNVFLNPVHDDMINPTRCSAIIMGNLVAGGDDHGIVLRDKCSPIVINNVISNCVAGGISVQNQCDALLINNTIVDCGRGVRLFDHTDRWRTNYCLFPGSGKVTVINCIIWDCPISFDLTDSPYTNDMGSHVTVRYSNIEGGRPTANVSANSTLTWGAENINSNPLFTNDLRLRLGSPSIDAGTNASVFLTNFSAIVTNDYDGVPRPLDGNGDGLARFDQGAYEFFLGTADSNGDGIPDDWTRRYGLNPTDPGVAGGNPDHDPHNTFEEWVADTNPTNALSFFRISGISTVPPAVLSFLSSSNRVYTLYSTAVLGSNTLVAVPGQVDVPGNGALRTLTDSSNSAPQKFYRISVKVP